MRTLVRDSAQILELIQRLKSLTKDDVLAIDTETTGLHPYQGDYLTGISLATGDDSWYVPIAHAGENVLESTGHQIVELISQSPALTVYHHAPFDWTFLHRYFRGFSVPKRYWDTKVVAWLLDENLPTGLKEQGALWFGEDAKAEQAHLRRLFKGLTIAEAKDRLMLTGWDYKTEKELIEAARRVAKDSKRTWGSLTSWDIWEYGCKDAELTLRLYYRQRDMKLILHHAAVREFDFQKVLYRMMQEGIRVDPVALDEALDAAILNRAELAYQEKPYDLGSPKQVKEALEVFGYNVPNTTRETLEKLADKSVFVRHVLEHRKLTKAIGTYYEGIKKHIAPDGRVHPWFSSTRTVTGRLSCSDPNLQTIPRGDVLPGVRELFIPEDGLELWEFDLSAAELRVIAALSGEERMIEALEDDGRDLHAETAELVFGKDWTPLQRRIAKNLNYGANYGIGPEKFARYMVAGTDRPVTPEVVAEAAKVLREYRRAYPKLTSFISGCEQYARDHGELPLPFTWRTRHFRSPGKVVPYYTAVNALVQGTVAELVKSVMLRLEPDLGLHRMLLQVHDSLVFETWDGPAIANLLKVATEAVNPLSISMPWEGKPWTDHD